MLPEFIGFNKIPRLSRDIIITEKIDGTNGIIFIDENNNIFAGSKSRWLWSSLENNEIKADNFGFGNWVRENQLELLKLGKGRHFGEWWGKGIQRNYGLQEKRFSLFNTGKWWDKRNGELKEESKLEYCPECCYIVPILYRGIFDTIEILSTLNKLTIKGSYASSGFMNPEGIIIYHIQGNFYFKKTILNDEKPKGVIE